MDRASSTIIFLRLNAQAVINHPDFVMDLTFTIALCPDVATRDRLLRVVVLLLHNHIALGSFHSGFNLTQSDIFKLL